MLQRFSVTALLILASPALAGSHHELDCESLSVASEDDVRTAFLCLADYQQRLDALEEKISKLVDANTNTPFVTPNHNHADLAQSTHSHDFPEIASGIVVASLNECGTLLGDWSDFHEARGRMIVGAGDHAKNGFSAGLSTRPVFVEGTVPGNEDPMAVGGEETVTLAEAQMPPHKHQIRQSESGDPTRFQQVEFGTGGRSFSIFHGRGDKIIPDAYEAAPAGGGGAHNNMPPYIALYFCKKD